MRNVYLIFCVMICGCGFLKNADLSKFYEQGISREQVADCHHANAPLAAQYIPVTGNWMHLQNDTYKIVPAIYESSFADRPEQIYLCEVWWRDHGVLGTYKDYVFYDREERVLGYYRDNAQRN